MVGKLNLEVYRCGVEGDADVISNRIASALDRPVELAFSELAHSLGHFLGVCLKGQSESQCVGIEANLSLESAIAVENNSDWRNGELVGERRGRANQGQAREPD